MAAFPPNRESILVGFTQSFATTLSGDPTRYSCTAAQATAYTTLSTAFVNAYTVANTKATRTALTIELKDSAKAALLANLRMLVKIIQNSPTTTNAMRIELNLPQRGTTPTPMPPLGKPTGFTVGIDPVTGALNLKWKNANPRSASGVVYQIWRRVGATGPFEYLGGAGKKAYADNTVPAGASQVQYQIQAVRSTSVGPFALFIVNVGSAGSGGGVTVTETAPVKLAA